MKMPWSLRIDIAVATLRGRAVGVSYYDGSYRVEVQRSELTRWLRRRDRMRAKAAKR